MLEQLIIFLEQELLISAQSIALAKKLSSNSFIFLLMILLQHGLITLKELDLIFDWMESQEGLNQN